MKPEPRIFPNPESMYRAAAEAFMQLARHAVAKQGRFTIAFAGGNTPRSLYQLLATGYRQQIPWPYVHGFWDDERYVPLDDLQSNYRMVRETLLHHVPIRAENIYPMPTDFAEPEVAARNYEQTLRIFFGSPWPRFDLILLGLGNDGHIASLFPHSSALKESARFVTVTQSPQAPQTRLTLTRPVINHAAQIHFLVTGDEKASAVRSTLQGPNDPQRFPAQSVQPANGKAIWWMDQDAAQLLK